MKPYRFSTSWHSGHAGDALCKQLHEEKSPVRGENNVSLSSLFEHLLGSFAPELQEQETHDLLLENWGGDNSVPSKTSRKDIVSWIWRLVVKLNVGELLIVNHFLRFSE